MGLEDDENGKHIFHIGLSCALCRSPRYAPCNDSTMGSFLLWVSLRFSFRFASWVSGSLSLALPLAPCFVSLVPCSNSCVAPRVALPLVDTFGAVLPGSGGAVLSGSGGAVLPGSGGVVLSGSGGAVLPG